MKIEHFLHEKGYTEDEILETELRLEAGMELPDEVMKDVREFWEKERSNRK